MYIARVPNRNSPPAILLRESYRVGNKVCNRTLANLTKWDPLRVEALNKALKGEFDGLEGVPETGETFGTLFALHQIAKENGIPQALGKKREALLSLFMILARVGHQGSRLSSVRWAASHAVKETLNIEAFTEDNLYKALDWLELSQEEIEEKLYKRYAKEHGKPPALLLYDVTSSYFEGEKNELAEYGYNRDKKKGKKQIVIELLTSDEGEPLAVRVFKGNTSDSTTMSSQIELLRSKFGIEEVIFVGDKGMIKSKGKEGINKEGWKYITSLSKREIKSLIKQGVFQADLFDKELQEVEHENKRYILKQNKAIREKLRKSRTSRLNKLLAKVEGRNSYVKEHKKAQAEPGKKQLEKLASDWRLDSFISLSLTGRKIKIEVDKEKQEGNFILDGCYVLETDVLQSTMDKEAIDRGYRNLHFVERGFRTIKTTLLEVRPIFLRKGNRTKAHVFIAMLALKITRLLELKLKSAFGVAKSGHYNVTLEESLNELSKINFLHYTIKGKKIARLPKLSDKQNSIFGFFTGSCVNSYLHFCLC